jgi:GNAT superfamily N-acetyltransferase
MAELASEQAPAAGRALESAVSLLHSRASAYDELAARAASRSWMPFRAAIPTEPLDTRQPAGTAPRDYCIVSADGSHIEPDRHGPAVCYLLNVGAAVIRYGCSPAARLSSSPLLGYRHEDLHISSGGTEIPVQDRVLALKRHIEEMRCLSRLAVEASGEVPVVAVADGTLLVSAWGQGDDSQVLDVLVSQFLQCLDDLRKNGVPVASYISRPRGSDVVNLLRLAACPYGNVECSSRCRGIAASATPCAHLSAIADRQVLEGLPLGPGERSAVFVSSWATSQQRYGAHKVRFFYLHVGSEIARVEVPEWVAEDPEALARTQSVVVDQAARGQGYPRALIEAHEKAVLSGGDRRAYSAMVEQALTAAGVRVGSSLKGVSKSVGQY